MGLPAVEAVELRETRRGSSRPTLRIVRIVNTSSPNNVRNAKGGTYLAASRAAPIASILVPGWTPQWYRNV